MFTRRDILRVSCGSLGAAGLAARFTRFGLMSAMAQSAPDYRALVCIFLFGGNDGNNLIVPLSQAGYDAYSKARSDLALAGSTLLPVEMKSGGAYGLHPKLSEVQQLFTQDRVAALANVGTLVAPLTRAQYRAQSSPVPANLFSHSDQQLQWQTSIPQGASTTGWGGRVADVIERMGLNSPSAFPAFVSVAGNAALGSGGRTQPVIFTPGGPLGLQGFNSTAASQARLLAAQETLAFDSGVSLVQAASGVVARGVDNAALLAKAMAGAQPLKTVFPKTSLGAQVQQVARIIQVRDDLGIRRQIFFCSLGGFDTHSAQLGDQQALFGQLSPAMGALYDATQELGVARSVVTFTESDFGRTLQANTNHGTDHAWGSHHLILGDAVKGGDLYGAFPDPTLGGPDDVDNRGRWIPTTALDQYGATLASWFGVGDADLHTVFPNLKNFSPAKLTFLG